MYTVVDLAYKYSFILLLESFGFMSSRNKTASLIIYKSMGGTNEFTFDYICMFRNKVSISWKVSC